MSDLTRRGIVRQVAGLTAGVLAASAVRGQEPPGTPASDREDRPKDLSGGLTGKMFSERVTFKTDPSAMEFWITTAAGAGHGEDKNFALTRRGSASVVRLDAGIDDFTRQGGVRWSCGGVEGEFQFKAPAETALVVREHDGTVTCYALWFDLRC